MSASGLSPIRDARPPQPVLPLDSPLFERWTDPVSGVTSHILADRVAPVQQTFYFVNTSFSSDGRYYWFYCAFPPAGSANQGRSLAVADFRKRTLTHFSETAFTDASPVIDEHTGEAYWCTGLEVWKRRPEPDAAPVFVNRFPPEIASNRRPWRLATHLTFSADRRALNVDVEIGSEWFVGHLPLDGGDFVLWQKFDRCFNHAQFHPLDPDLQLIAQDHSIHPISGKSISYENRLWVIRRGQSASPLFPNPLTSAPQMMSGNPHYYNDVSRMISDERALVGHEWWSPDGRYVWYVHYGTGVARVPVGGGGEEVVWRKKLLSHAHVDRGENWLVADALPPEAPEKHQVLFYNLATGKQVEIVSHLPQIPPSLSRYHIHPHPQFCLQDRFVCYTTNVRGRVDVAFVDVDELISRTL